MLRKENRGQFNRIDSFCQTLGGNSPDIGVSHLNITMHAHFLIKFYLKKMKLKCERHLHINLHMSNGHFMMPNVMLFYFRHSNLKPRGYLNRIR